MHALHASQQAPENPSGSPGSQFKAKIRAYGDSLDTTPVLTVEQSGVSGRFGLTPFGFVSQTPIKSLVIELVEISFIGPVKALGLGSIFFDTSE